MKKQIRYTNEPIGKVKVVKDFLPSPDQLAFREDTVKVTMVLNKASVEFFKQEAQKHHTSYQVMIRNLLDLYARHHRDEGSAR